MKAKKKKAAITITNRWAVCHSTKLQLWHCTFYLKGGVVKIIYFSSLDNHIKEWLTCTPQYASRLCMVFLQSGIHIKDSNLVENLKF